MISKNKSKNFWEKSFGNSNWRFLCALTFYKTLVFNKSGKIKKKYNREHITKFYENGIDWTSGTPDQDGKIDRLKSRIQNG